MRYNIAAQQMREHPLCQVTNERYFTRMDSIYPRARAFQCSTCHKFGLHCVDEQGISASQCIVCENPTKPDPTPVPVEQPAFTHSCVKATDRSCIKCGEAPRIESKRYCRTCWNAYMRSRYNYNEQRDRQLQASYGMSLDEYNALFHAQDGVCAICKQPETNRPGCKKRTENIVPMLHVDHDHVTGKIRGLLCSGCNNALGSLQDDPKRIKAMLKYLKSQSNK